MLKEIEMDGKGWARGRNGYFVPRRLDCFKDVRGMINFQVGSSRAGKVDPISLRLTKAEALKLADTFYSLAGNPQGERRVVVVVEGGNVQSIFANNPVRVVKVDYEVDGTPREELRRVLQFGNGDKKSYELASVRHWGAAEVCPEETNRFFRNAMD